MATSHSEGPALASDDRRRFLRFLGAGTLAVGAAGTLAACDSSEANFNTPPINNPNPNPNPDPDPDPDPDPAGVVFDFSSPVGVLNYAYALEQLEAAFYGLVTGLSNFTTLFPNPDEQQLLRDLAAHEGIHRDFLAAAIDFTGAGNRIIDLTPNPDAFDLSTRSSILSLALTFEDLGVAAYNGAGQYIPDTAATNPYLTLAGKIVSVEARHAAAIATALDTGSTSVLGGANVINPQGLDRALRPRDVLDAAQTYVLNPLDADND